MFDPVTMFPVNVAPATETVPPVLLTARLDGLLRVAPSKTSKVTMELPSNEIGSGEITGSVYSVVVAPVVLA